MTGPATTAGVDPAGRLAAARARSAALAARMQRVDRIMAITAVFLPLSGTVAAIALWLAGHGPGMSAVVLFAVGWLVTLFAIEGGYHRLLSHGSYTATPRLRQALAILGSTSLQGPVIWWVANHRRHHKHADAPGDPHSPHTEGGILRGLVHAHVGWQFSPAHLRPEQWMRYAADLFRDRQLLAIHMRYPLWLALGLLVPAVLGGIAGASLYGAAMGVLWGGLVRIFVVNHTIYAINSVCHTLGGRHPASRDRSVNNGVLALLSLGASWHNNHHRYPGRAILGFRWWQLDPSGWIIRGLQLVGLVTSVNGPVDERSRERGTRPAAELRAGEREPS